MTNIALVRHPGQGC